MYQYHSYENTRCIMLFVALVEEDVICIDLATFSYFKLPSTIIEMTLGSSFWSFSFSAFRFMQKTSSTASFLHGGQPHLCWNYSSCNFDNLLSISPRRSRKILFFKPPSKLLAGLRKLIIFQYSFFALIFKLNYTW